MAPIGLLIWLVGIQMAITYVAEDGDRCSGPVTPVGCEHNHDPVTDVIAWGFLLISAAAIVGVVVSAWREKRQREAAQDLEGDGAPAALTADIWGEPQPPAPHPPAEPLYGYIRSSRMGYTPLMESSQPKVSEQIAREELAGHPWTPDQEERLAAYDRERADEGIVERAGTALVLILGGIALAIAPQLDWIVSPSGLIALKGAEAGEWVADICPFAGSAAITAGIGYGLYARSKVWPHFVALLAGGLTLVAALGYYGSRNEWLKTVGASAEFNPAADVVLTAGGLFVLGGAAYAVSILFTAMATSGET